jgi:hypothetical protein
MKLMSKRDPTVSMGPVIAARDELRSLIPRLDHAIASGEDQAALLKHVREVAWRHADGLRFALKRPDRQPRERASSARYGPLWGTDEGTGRYQQPIKRTRIQ